MKKRSKSSSIYFLVPYPIGFAPSQRFRFEQYFQILQQRGYKIKHQSFLAETHWKLFNTKGQLFTKSFVIIVGLVKRLVALVQIQSFTFVFIHREAAPIGPPFFEWIIAKIFRKKIIYDFDDAIWLTDRKNESLSTQFIRWRNKVSSICKWSCNVSCGNAYLADYARQYNSNIVINPTTIDAVQLHNPDNLNIKKNPDRLVIGWTGSHSTLKYLDGLMNCMRLLQDK